METKAGALDRIRKFGGHMSGMVMPNLGAFVGWGLLAALFIPTGWIPNEKLNEMVGPILNYLLPLLIGYTAGYNIHGQRGGVIGAFTTMGVIVGSDITMFSGAMIMGKCDYRIFDGRNKLPDREETDSAFGCIHVSCPGVVFEQCSKSWNHLTDCIRSGSGGR